LDAIMPAGTGTQPGSDACLSTYGRVAPFYDLLDIPYEYLWKRRLRARIFARAAGRILDAGVGTGPNVPFYPPGAEVTGLDFSGAMLGQARRAAARHGRAVTLVQGDATDTKLPGGSFDAVVATFLVCCLPPAKQVEALREWRRLLAPGGAIYLLDYTLPPGRLLRGFMQTMTALWTKTMFSTRYDNHPEPRFADAGLAVAAREEHIGGAVLLHTLRAESNPVRPE
jgi:demethylmenaquinone methyltransferase/2-methoxy-6-polyprenyl-1,4-benzoquinol methylase